jgi:hypothetical protein
VPSQQLQGQLQTQVIALWTNNIKSRVNYRRVLEEKDIDAEKQTSKQRKIKGNKNDITQNFRILNKEY